MARPDQPVLAAARGRTRILVALLAASIAVTALWIASSPTALPAQLAPVTSAAERVLAALVAAGLGVYALAAAREAAEAARSRRWRLLWRRGEYNWPCRPTFWRVRGRLFPPSRGFSRPGAT